MSAKHCLIVTAVVLSALTVAILGRGRISANKSTTAQMSISDATGVKIVHFFDGLRSDPRLRGKKGMHGKIVGPQCQQKPGLLAQIASGVETVAYAQQQCPQDTVCRGPFTFCGAVRVTNILCTECGNSWQYGTLWQMDTSAAQISVGYQDNNQIKCGQSRCGCNLDECSCMGG